MNRLVAAFCCAIAVLPSAVSAANISYSVDRIFTAAETGFGPSARLQGTITTDGTIGLLAPGNIVGWNLAIATGTQSAAASSANSILTYDIEGPAGYGHGMFATATEIEFRLEPSYSGVYSLFSISGGAAGTTFAWCIGTNFCASDLGTPDEQFWVDSNGAESRSIVSHQNPGDQTIGTASPPIPTPTTVPLPASIGLLAAALLAAGSLRHGRRLTRRT